MIRTRRSGVGGERGYAMAALLVGLAVMSIVMSAILPAWRHQAQREREAELIFRGEQYARAVALFQRKYAGAFPPSVDLLVEQRFLRRRYKDPMTKDGEFQLLYQASLTQPGGVPGTATPGQTAPQPGAPPSGPTAGAGTPGISVQPTFGGPVPGAGAAGGGTLAGPQGGIIGVTSKSKEQSIKLYNGRDRYNEWQFVYTAVSTQAGAPGVEPGTTPGQMPGGAGTRVPGAGPGTLTPGAGPRPMVPPSRPPRPPGR